jgi:integrase/recombinase XerD
MKNIIIERVIRDGGNRITLRFPYDQELNCIVKELADAQWSSDMKYWHICDSPDVISLLLKAFSGKANVDYSSVKINLAEKIRIKKEEEENRQIIKNRIKAGTELPPLSKTGEADIEKYRIWMEANRYPDSTILTYTSMMVKFLRFMSPKEASQCTSDDLIRMINEFILPNRLSYSFQNQMISSVKKFYGNIYKSVIDPGKLDRPRSRHRLPNVLSKEDVKKIVTVLANEKHRVMLSLIYACGLRRSELLELIPSDIERGRMLLRIRQSKGFKDRIVPLSERTIGILNSYIEHFKPIKYLFEGQWPGEKYSASSLEKVLKNACKRAGLRKEISLHWLRHSYATHLLESGTDITFIQELLGHKSSRTTEIYLHISTKSLQNIRSPFDDL